MHSISSSITNLDPRHLHLLLNSLQQQHQTTGTLIKLLRSIIHPPTAGSSSSSTSNSLPLRSQWIKPPRIPISPPAYTITILTPSDPRWTHTQHKHTHKQSREPTHIPQPQSGSSSSSIPLLSISSSSIPSTDLDLVHSSSSSSGSSSSSSSSVSGSAEPSGTHACIPSIANPSLSVSNHCPKRKLADVAGTDEAQLPRSSVAQRGELNGHSSVQTTEPRADTDEDGGSADEVRSDEEVQSESVAGSSSSSSSGYSSSKQCKKRSKRQKRKEKRQSAERESVIREARDGWMRLKTLWTNWAKTGDECFAFGKLKDMPMDAETRSEFRSGYAMKNSQFRAVYEQVVHHERRFRQMLCDHPSIIRPRSNFDHPLDKGQNSGTFDEEFEIVS